MEDKLRRYVDGLFEEAAVTKKSVELKEEMIQNLQDKYSDLLQEGKPPEAAFNIAVAGIGDVTMLLKELENEGKNPPDEAARRKSAMFTAIAVMLYIISVLPVIIIGAVTDTYDPIIGVVIMFVIVAIATGLLIYNSMTKPKYYKESDTVVEEFREWQDETHERKQMRKAISSALWTIVTAIYIIVSFWTHAWHITWIIFLIAGAIESLINVFLSAKKKS
ncbi:MAG: permease prefix domain 1-containing protein [Oscillospiraceae bacterium]|nr:permease prefix domain 1-containing protein [Oscillospiraceae bacterium]